MLNLAKDENTYPRETNASDAIGKHVTQNGRERVTRWEISVKPRMLPVGHLCITNFKLITAIKCAKGKVATLCGRNYTFAQIKI